jgi:hypothetical protein
MTRIALHKLFAALSTYMWRVVDLSCNRGSSAQIKNPGQPSHAGALLTP